MAEKNNRDYNSYQQKIIKRYYDNMDTIKGDRLADLVGELYLSEGKKKDRLWKQVEDAMIKLEIPAPRMEHILKQKNPAILAELVKELQSKK